MARRVWTAFSGFAVLVAAIVIGAPAPEAIGATDDEFVNIVPVPPELVSTTAPPTGATTSAIASSLLAPAETRQPINSDDFSEVPAGETLHVKFIDGVAADGQGRLVVAEIDASVAAALDSPSVSVETLFPIEPDTSQLSPRDGQGVDLASWFRVAAPSVAQASLLFDVLNASPSVEAALFEPPVASASLAVQGSPNFEPNQLYRGAAPDGVDADYASTVAGGTGNGIVLTDVEYSWNTQHEDLGDTPGTEIPNGIPKDPFTNTDHGTAVLGVVTGEANGFGVTGIAPDVSIQLVNSFTTAGQKLTDALGLAAANSDPGDVILIEQQVCPVAIIAGTCGPGWLPVEWFPSYYDAIVAAVDTGVHVVQAGGNGARNVDPVLGFPDSGSILVGAGGARGCVPFGPEPPNGRVDFSNYGNRMDLQSHGGCVWTTGSEAGGTNPNDNLSYTGNFNGTSSASAVVAGAVASLAGVAHANGDPLAPNEMRALLRVTGTPQDTSLDSRNIGPQPDLRAAIDAYLVTPHPAPSNDDFHSAASMSIPGRLHQPTVGASIQVGEPLPTCGFPDSTLWYELMPSTDLEVIVGVVSQRGASVALWWQETPDFLTEIGCASAGSHLADAPVRARLQKGERYLVQVGDGGAEPIDVVVGQPPSCDVNRDGFGDLLLGVPGEGVAGKPGAGALNVYYGHRDGSPDHVPLITQASPEVADRPERGDGFGTSVVCADFDGDGFDDAAVGVPGEGRGGIADVGIVQVFPGGPAGLSGRSDTVISQDRGSIRGVRELGDRFGEDLAAGDVNGDGYDDLVAGVPGEGREGKPHSGLAQLVLGGPGGLGTGGVFSIHQNSSGVPGKREAGDRFGSVVSVGDTDGDGFDDVVVGTPNEGIAGAADRGAVVVVPGGPSGPEVSRSRSINPAPVPGSNRGLLFGSSLAIGDLNGDGFRELVVGSPRTAESQAVPVDAGLVHVFPGSSSGLVPSSAFALDGGDLGHRSQAGDRLGAMVVAADRDADAMAELYLGSPGADATQGQGVVASGAMTIATFDAQFAVERSVTISQDSPGVAGMSRSDADWAATIVVRDLDGDLLAELIVGAPGQGRPSTPASGMSVIIWGTGGALDHAASRSLGQDHANVAGMREPGDMLAGALG